MGKYKHLIEIFSNYKQKPKKQNNFFFIINPLIFPVHLKENTAKRNDEIEFGLKTINWKKDKFQIGTYVSFELLLKWNKLNISIRKRWMNVFDLSLFMVLWSGCITIKKPVQNVSRIFLFQMYQKGFETPQSQRGTPLRPLVRTVGFSQVPAQVAN